MSVPYDASFYAAQAVASTKSARVILPELFACLQPQSVLDVGCGIGTWLRVACDLGARVILGVDGDYVEQRQLMIPSESFVPVDLACPGLKEKVLTIHPNRFDLVMCLEVAEHLPYERSASLAEELCQLGDVLLFSAAIPFQGGTQHVNEQWPEFWALLFRRLGFVCYDWLRQQIWAAPNVDWWYAQNVLLFVRESSSVRADLPANAVVERGALSRVHPGCWLSGLLNKVVVHGASAWRDESEDLNTVLRDYVQGERLPPVLRTVERARLAQPGARDVFPWTRLDNASLADFERLKAEEGELQRLRADNQSLDSELQRLRADNQFLDSELQRLRADNQSLDSELQRLNRERKDSLAELYRVDAERERLLLKSRGKASHGPSELALSQFKVQSSNEQLKFRKRVLGQLRYSALGYGLRVSLRVLQSRSLLPLRDWRAARVISRSNLFDRRWYFENNPDVAAWGINPIHHYVEHGAEEGRNPNRFFDTRTYLSCNPDVHAAGVNPFAHYVLYGAAEDRPPYHRVQ
jgi:SAM-dependent methyltransferase